MTGVLLGEFEGATLMPGSISPFGVMTPWLLLNVPLKLSLRPVCVTLRSPGADSDWPVSGLTWPYADVAAANAKIPRQAATVAPVHVFIIFMSVLHDRMPANVKGSAPFLNLARFDRQRSGKRFFRLARQAFLMGFVKTPRHQTDGCHDEQSAEADRT